MDIGIGGRVWGCYLVTGEVQKFRQVGRKREAVGESRLGRRVPYYICYIVGHYSGWAAQVC